MPRKARDLRVRFEEKISKDSHGGCWKWLSADNKRYGMFWVNGKTVYAHRIAYELYVGPIPEDMYVCHRCDNTRCVNPSHLFVGTAYANVADKFAKGRAADQRGERNPRSKLTAEQVVEIRNLRRGGITQREIAARFGVSREAISRILVGIGWRHL